MLAEQIEELRRRLGKDPAVPRPRSLRSRQPVPQVRDHRLQRRDLLRLRREPSVLLPEPLRLLPDQRITRIRRQLIRRRIGHGTRSSRKSRPAITATPHLTLKRNRRSHTVQGVREDKRTGKVLASRTYDDLDVLTADIPTGLTRAQPAEPARPSDNGKKVIWRASAALGGTVFVTAEAAALPHLPVVPALFVGSVAGMFVAGLLAVLLTLIKWVLDRSSGRQPSHGPPPGARDNAARHPAPAGPAGEPRQIGHRLWPGAEAARSRPPRSPSAGLRSPQRLRSLTTLA